MNGERSARRVAIRTLFVSGMVVAGTTAIASCGDPDRPEESSRAVSTSSTAVGATSTPSSKPSTGIEGSVTWEPGVARVGEDIAFVATFEVSASSESATFRAVEEGVARVDVVGPMPLQLGVPVEISGSITAEQNGSGVVGLEVERVAGDSTVARRLTVHVAAEAGVVVLDDSSESAARTSLADEMLRQGIIDVAEHRTRLREIAGG